MLIRYAPNRRLKQRLLKWAAFHDLFVGQRSPRNGCQEVLRRALDAARLIHSDGVEAILNVSDTLSEDSAAFMEVGLVRALPILKRIQEVLAAAPRNDEIAFWNFVQDHSDILDGCTEAFWDNCADYDDLLYQYVSNHPAEFEEYLPNSQGGA